MIHQCQQCRAGKHFSKGAHAVDGILVGHTLHREVTEAESVAVIKSSVEDNAQRDAGPGVLQIGELRTRQSGLNGRKRREQPQTAIDAAALRPTRRRLETDLGPGIFGTDSRTCDRLRDPVEWTGGGAASGEKGEKHEPSIEHAKLLENAKSSAHASAPDATRLMRCLPIQPELLPFVLSRLVSGDQSPATPR